MARKKNTKSSRFLFLGIFLLGLVMLGYGAIGSYNLISSSGTQSFSLLGDAVYEPVFGNLQCAKTDRPTQDLYYYPYGKGNNIKIDVQDINGNSIRTISSMDIECSRGLDSVYTNQCRVEAKLGTDDWASMRTTDYLCDYNQFNTNVCQKLNVKGFTDSWTYVTDLSRDQVLKVRDITKTTLGFSREITKGEIVFRIKRDEYGLISLTNGRLEKANSCDLQDILRATSNRDILSKDFSKAKIDGKIKGSELEFGQFINYVIGWTQITESKRIIENKKFYTFGNGKKYPIITGESGRKYVDLQNPINAPNIICDPALLYCINEGTKIDIQFGKEDTCKDGVDLIDGWLPSTEKNNHVANRVCKNGNWVEINVKPIPECSGDKPILNSNYECVAGTQKESARDGEDLKENYLPLLILAGSIVLITLSRRRALEEG